MGFYRLDYNDEIQGGGTSPSFILFAVV